MINDLAVVKLRSLCKYNQNQYLRNGDYLASCRTPYVIWVGNVNYEALLTDIRGLTLAYSKSVG